MKKSDCFCSIKKLQKSKKSWIFTRIWLSFLTKCLASNQIAHYPREKNGHDIIGQYLTQPATVQCCDMS